MIRCRRCSGCLAWEPTALVDIRYRWNLGAWRCLNCGDYLDLEILRRRRERLRAS